MTGDGVDEEHDDGDEDEDVGDDEDVLQPGDGG